jgi:hypothetical protein
VETFKTRTEMKRREILKMLGIGVVSKEMVKRKTPTFDDTYKAKPQEHVFDVCQNGKVEKFVCTGDIASVQLSGVCMSG